MVNKARASAFGSGSVSVSKFSSDVPIDTPKITSIAYVGDDTATNTAGGDTITINGSSFKSGCYVFVDRSQASVVSFISSTQITFTAPAKSAGTYTLYVFNPDGGTAIYIPGISYSGTPTWSTVAGSIGSVYETVELSSNVSVLSATSNSTVRYRLFSGSLPTNAVLNTNTGAITGVTSAVAGVTTYTFVIEAYDLENQGTLRTFSITLNPDVVTWSSPVDGNTITINVGTVVNQSLNASSAASKTITYTANTLPTGLSISGNTVTGTPTVGQTITSLFTATAASTNRVSTRILNWIINAIDIYFPYVSLLIKTGSQSTRSTTVIDSSVNNLTVTRNGSPSTGLNSPYQTNGYWSNYFNGSSDYLDAPASTVFNLTGSFTVETWFYLTSIPPNNSGGTPTACLVNYWNTSVTQTGWEFTVTTGVSGNISFQRPAIGTVGILANYPSFALNTWYHVAATYNGTTGAIYLNGNPLSLSLNTWGWAAPSSPTLRIGRGFATGYFHYFPGYISNLRVTNGTVIYTGNFTPSTTPLTAISGTSLLTCQSNRFIDNSTNAFTITPGGAPQTTPYYYPNTFPTPTISIGGGYFNGSTDYLTASSPNLSGSWTVEMWCYWTTSGTQTTIVSFNNGSYSGINLWKNTSNQLVADDGVNGQTAFSTVTPVINAWNHIAFVRNGTTTSAYVNGVLAGSNSFTPQTTSAISVGRYNASAYYYFPGYISNLRVVNGIAVYTGNFTPPTNFLTTIGGTYPSTSNVNASIASSNTSALLNFADSNYTSIANTSNNNVFIDGSPYAFPITRNGTPTQGSFTPYWPPDGYWGGYFTGGNYVSTSTASANLRLDQGNWTMEFWLYLTTWNTNNRIFDTGANGDGTVMVIGYDNTGLFYFGTPTAGTGVGTPSGTIGLNTWYHIACTSDGAGSNGRIFVNGVLKAGPTNYTNPSGTTASYNLGRNNVSGGTWSGLQGYMNNFRFVSGQRLYTSNFTPQTTPLNKNTYSTDGGVSFSNITGTTQLLTLQNNRFKDSSNNNFTFNTTGSVKVSKFQPFSIPSSFTQPPSIGSGYFNGGGDYLTIPDSTPFNLSGGVYTIEGWINPNGDYSNYRTIVAKRVGDAVGQVAWEVYLRVTTGVLSFFNGNNIESAVTPQTNAWSHFAAVYDGTNINLYLNGVRVIQTATVNNNVSGSVLIGSYPAYNEHYIGFIANLRIVKRVMVYTGNFTPPSLGLLTSDGATSASSYANTSNVSTTFGSSSTSLLQNFNNGSIYDTSNQNDLVTISNTQVSNTTSKWSPTSIKFNGSTDYLYYPDNQIFNFTSSDFTVESWIYLNAIPTSDAWPTNYNLHMVLGTTGTPNLGDGVGFIIGQTKLIIQSNDTQYASTAHGLSTGTWYHIAYVRYGNNFYFYVNGVSKGSAAFSSSVGTGSGTYIGCETGQGAFFNGYMQDLRVTKTARYTSAFSVPTLEFITR